MTFGVPQQLFVPLASDLAMDVWMDQRLSLTLCLVPCSVVRAVSRAIGRHRDLMLFVCSTSMTVESRAM
jgi:hypothetical protein